MEILTTILLLFSHIPAPAVPDAPAVFAETPQGKVYLLVDSKPRAAYAWNGQKMVKVSEASLRGVTLVRAGRDTVTLESSASAGQMTRDQHLNSWRLVRDPKNPKSTHIEVRPAGTDAWQAPLEAEASQPDDYKTIMADEVGYVWISSPKGVSCIDPRDDKNAWNWTAPAAVTSLGMSPNGRALVGLSNGTVYELSRAAKGGKVATPYTAQKLPAKPIRAIHTDGDGSVWILAGSEVYKAAPTSDAWQRHWKAFARMPISDHDIFGAHLDGKIYIFGGMGSYGYPTKFKYYDDLFALDLRANRWEVVSNLPPARAYNGSAALDGRIWVIGGRVLGATGKSDDTTPIDRVDIYDPKTSKWAEGPKLPNPRTECIVIPVNGRIYVIGGTNGKDTLSIATGEKEWRVEPSPPGGAFIQSSGCEIGGKIYLLSPPTSSALCYDPVERVWTKLPTPPVDLTMWAAICGAHNGEFWVMGGNTDKQLSFIYSPKTNTWRSGPAMPTPLGWTSALNVDGRLIVTPGGSTSKALGYFIFTERAYELRPGAESLPKH